MPKPLPLLAPTDMCCTPLVGAPLTFVGTAEAQTRAFVEQVARVVERHPDAAAYRPEPLL